MGEFLRDRLPEPAAFFESEGLKPIGHGEWRTTRCDFHDGSDSMRLNIKSGAWVCMSCGTKGGDVLAYAMQHRGLSFVQAATALGAFVENGKPYAWRDAPRAFSARDALEVIALELPHTLVIISDLRRGVIPSEAAWDRWLHGAGQLQAIAQEFRR